MKLYFVGATSRWQKSQKPKVKALQSMYIQGDNPPHYYLNLPYSTPKPENVRLIKISLFKYQECYRNSCTIYPCTLGRVDILFKP